jgi:hypothetical protein
VNDSASSIAEHDAQHRRRDRSAFGHPANMLARAVAWGFVRTLIGLLAAGIFVFYAATIG